MTAQRVDQVFKGKGPLYLSTDVSPSQKVPYYQIGAKEQSYYLSQDGQVARDSLSSGDYKPYLLKTTDLGRTWTSIAGNLPQRGTVYVVIDDPKDPNLLYAGTEFGLWVSRNGGGSWGSGPGDPRFATHYTSGTHCGCLRSASLSPFH